MRTAPSKFALQSSLVWFCCAVLRLPISSVLHWLSDSSVILLQLVFLFLLLFYFSFVSFSLSLSLFFHSIMDISCSSRSSLSC